MPGIARPVSSPAAKKIMRTCTTASVKRGGPQVATEVAPDVPLGPPNFSVGRRELAVVLVFFVQDQGGEKVGIVCAMKMTVIPLDVSGDAGHFATEFLQHVERRGVPAKAQAQVAERGVVGAQMSVVGVVGGRTRSVRAGGAGFNGSVVHDRPPRLPSKRTRLQHRSPERFAIVKVLLDLHSLLFI